MCKVQLLCRSLQGTCCSGTVLGATDLCECDRSQSLPYGIRTSQGTQTLSGVMTCAGIDGRDAGGLQQDVCWACVGVWGVHLSAVVSEVSWGC